VRQLGISILVNVKKKGKDSYCCDYYKMAKAEIIFRGLKKYRL